LIIGLLSIAAAAQESDAPLATMSGQSFTVADLPADVAKAWRELPSTLVIARKDLLELQIDNMLLLQEANKRSIDVDALLDIEVTKRVKDPDEKTVKALYDENKASIGDTPLAEIRPQIVNYLRMEPEKKAREDFSRKLRTSGKIEYGKNVNDEGLSLNDVIATVNGEPITFAMYKRKNALPLYEYEANVFDQLDSSLRMIVDAAVYQVESQSLEIPVNQLIAREITSKMKDFTADEQNRLEKTLKNKLYSKYRVKYFVTEPEPYVQEISVDDDPSFGAASPKATVVVFADFECPACAGVHPILKQLLKKYGSQVRLVYRDFPLTKIHENALPAARAAYAASKQGKFFEFGELLYDNQTELDSASLEKYAKQLGLDLQKFNADRNSEEALAEIKKDLADGNEYGVTGTPSIFVNGYKIRTLSVQAFEQAIERAIIGVYN